MTESGNSPWDLLSFHTASGLFISKHLKDLTKPICKRRWPVEKSATFGSCSGKVHHGFGFRRSRSVNLATSLGISGAPNFMNRVNDGNWDPKSNLNFYPFYAPIVSNHPEVTKRDVDLRMLSTFETPPLMTSQPFVTRPALTYNCSRALIAG